MEARLLLRHINARRVIQARATSRLLAALAAPSTHRAASSTKRPNRENAMPALPTRLRINAERRSSEKDYLNRSPLLSSARREKFQKHLTVKPVDIAGTIELFEKSRVEELLGVGAFRRGNLIGELGSDRVEAFHRGIGLSRQKAAQQLIGVVQLAVVLQAHVFAKRSLGHLRINGHELNAVDN